MNRGLVISIEAFRQLQPNISHFVANIDSVSSQVQRDELIVLPSERLNTFVRNSFFLLLSRLEDAGP